MNTLSYKTFSIVGSRIVWQSLKKRLVSIGVKKFWQSTMAVLQQKIVTGDVSWIYAYEPETKQQSTVRVFEDEPNPTKVVREGSTSKQIIACFFFLFRLSIVGRSILSGTSQFVCLKSSQKFEKQTTEDKLLFAVTMRALTHRHKPAPFWPAKTSNVLNCSVRYVGSLC